MLNKPPMPSNELERLANLADFDIDYTNLQESFKDLNRLAAKIAGANISLVNLIDSFTQWTISTHGLDLKQMPREESVCQYTIVEEEHFEVPNLSADDRFKDLFYVAGGANLKYYYGLPLKTSKGVHIGALCVLDYETKTISDEKVELLKIIADEIVNRLRSLKVMARMQYQLNEAYDAKKRLAHDVRGPLAGIIGIVDLALETKNESSVEDVYEYFTLIQESSNSILELANDILTVELQPVNSAQPLDAGEYNQLALKEKLESLYGPQAMAKKVRFSVSTESHSEQMAFSKNKLLQIIGNLVSNAIKFTSPGGEVKVDLQLIIDAHHNELVIKVKDSGVGISKEGIELILEDGKASTDGTFGENGFGLGLPVVKKLVDSLGGTFTVSSEVGLGSVFEVVIPQIKTS